MLHEPPALPGLPPPLPAAPGSGPFLVVCFDGLAPHSQRACQEFLPQLAQAGVPRVSFLTLVREALLTRTPATCGDLAASAAAP